VEDAINPRRGDGPAEEFWRAIDEWETWVTPKKFVPQNKIIEAKQFEPERPFSYVPYDRETHTRILTNNDKKSHRLPFPQQASFRNP
jgi:hypothetical protein